MSSPKAERLQKLMAQWGIASRRDAEKLILAGRVKVNGQLAQLGQKADPLTDAITVDGRPLKSENRPDKIHILFNKPLNVLSTCHDSWDRPTVLSYLPPSLQQGQGLHIVGRLDADSTGAILLTNDGVLTFSLTHPSHHVPKTYQVWVKGHPSASVLRDWQEGVILSGKRTLPAEVRVIGHRSNQTFLEIILREGRNRQIRRVAEQLGYPVVSLTRVAIGDLKLNDLKVGQYRFLQPFEVISLCSFLDNSMGLQYAK